MTYSHGTLTSELNEIRDEMASVADGLLGSDAGVSPDVIAAHTSRPDPVTRWAEITKAQKINVEQYTTRGDDVFVIEVVK